MAQQVRFLPHEAAELTKEAVSLTLQMKQKAERQHFSGSFASELAVRSVERLLNKPRSLTFSNAFRLMHLLDFLLSRIVVVCWYSWIRPVSLLFEGETDADGPDLSFACTTIQVERTLVNSRCVRTICLCAHCNLLLKHP